MPRLDFPQLIASEKPVVMQISGDAGALFSIYFTTVKTYGDLSALLPIDMVMLIDFFQAFHAGLANLPAGGTIQFPVVLPGDPMIWGSGVAIQAVLFDPVGQSGRFTNVRDLIIVP